MSEATSTPPPAPAEAKIAEGSDVLLEVHADLDVPGETRRQGRVFVTWFVCLVVAVVVGSLAGAHVPMSQEGSSWAEEQLAEARSRRIKIGLALGLLLPALVNAGINARYRRGGAHARGIVVDLTRDGELRLWGRGYGVRVRLADAEWSERLVDVYAGRLGAWRQRRLRLRGAAGSKYGPQEIELSAPATAADAEVDHLRVEGGEGDCVELTREDFDRVRARVTKG